MLARGSGGVVNLGYYKSNFTLHDRGDTTIL